MKKKSAWIAAVLVILGVAALCVNVSVTQKRIGAEIYTELEYRGYPQKAVAEVKIDHSYVNRILGFREWRISVAFHEIPDVFFWFSYQGNKFRFEGVSSEPMMDTDSAIAYSEKFKQGTLLQE